MRQPRLKPSGQNTWHHCYNRLVGTHEDRPLSDADKEQFVRILRRVAKLYTVRIVAYQVMSNHFHLLLMAPAEKPSAEETARRVERFFRGRRRVNVGTAACARWQERLGDVSWCLRHLEQLFAGWYNRTRAVRRRGPVWAGRFKNTVLESGEAVWRCWAYLEHNAVRAGLVAEAGAYRFSSYGWWVQRGRHPFEGAVEGVLKPALPEPYCRMGRKGLRRALGEELRRRSAEAGRVGVLEAESEFVLGVWRRVRHWVDGVVIGTELFVRETMRRARGEVEAARRRLVWAVGAGGEPTSLCCWQRLRAIPS